MHLGRGVLVTNDTPPTVHAVMSDAMADRALCGQQPMIVLPGDFADCCDDRLCPACLAKAGLR